MQHIIEWKLQPERRSPNRSAAIREARHQVHELQQEHPRFTDDRIRALWSRVQQSAINEAERDMNQVIHNVPELTW